MAGLEISTEGEEPTARIVARGDLDLETAPELDAAIATAGDRLTLDLTGVCFIDSTGLALLLRRRLKLARVLVSPDVRRVAALAGVAAHLPIGDQS